MEATGGRLPFLEWGIAGRPISGETESGDQYVVHSWPGGALLAVIDGLGHGPAAALAANEAVAILQAHAQEPLVLLVSRCHEALRRTNGAVMTLAAFQASDNSLTWLGVGNVEGLLIRADALARPSRDDVLQRGGVVGYQLPPLRTSALVVGEGDILIFATDGVRGRFADRLDLERPPQEVAIDVLDSHAKPNDDALVLVARFSALAP
jgi:negative regulator of sigma-B (phosphoserine phosphatase)